MTKTRYWDNPGFSSTAVQFRTDTEPMIWMHTNIGWVPIGNTPVDRKEAEHFAEELAAGYNLEERGREFAEYMLG